jgi:tRNA threonylcarbamoyladenosine biosynthesis protein TsaB
MAVLGFDTATPATAVALALDDGSARVAHETPAPGQRPGHATRLLVLADELLTQAGLAWPDVRLVAVGTGPGSFTGLRIGVATARGLAQSLGVGLVGVGTLRALAAAASAPGAGPVAAVLDARRGEAFVAVYDGERELLAPSAVAPEDLAAALAPPPRAVLAVGDGAIRFSDQLQAAGVAVPADASSLHSVDAAVICRLADRQPSSGCDAVVPCYVRRPDAEISRGSANE